jgi:hypothetical protein
MSIISWLRNRTLARPLRWDGFQIRPTTRRFRPRLEALEDRWLPSTLTVTNNLNSGAGSLRAEIAAAQNNDTIVFAPSLDGKTITLTTSELDITKNLTIQGPGTGQVAVSGGNFYRVFEVRANTNVSLSRLTITQGNSYYGGGIFNGGTLTVSACTLSSNHAASVGAQGGGIYIALGGVATLTNCTFVGNRAAGCGGGLFVDRGTVTLTNCTLSGNSASEGGGIYVSPSVYFFVDLTNTIVAGNHALNGPDIYGRVGGDHNLVGNAAGSSGIVNGVNGNIVGGNGNPVINALLGPLQNNGGPTQTMALLPGSPAIGHADNSQAPATDQRGVTRLDLAGETTDIGAFEVQALSLALGGFPSTTTAGAAGTFTVTALNADGTTNTSYSGTIHFTSTDGQVVLPADYTFTAADNGSHVFSATLKTAGTQSITATDTITTGLTSSQTGITVNPAAASKLVIIGPTTVTAGVSFSITVTAYDPYGNVATGYTGKVHFKSTDSTAKLPANYTFTASNKGTHTFSGLVLNKKGKQSIKATDTLFSTIFGSLGVDVL